jgi:hypothetical protein
MVELIVETVNGGDCGITTMNSDDIIITMSSDTTVAFVIPSKNDLSPHFL